MLLILLSWPGSPRIPKPRLVKHHLNTQ
ncbi:hypothetical protein KP509_10G069500 [Ceratopteris richardii]|uniref:Uncharacterized protein n=1 Tax=Ceratopteris richardii TaxID=49495 RepID=A0A8T2U2H3_CERRI|nr:hypothetical protein KP509_10G069500 [Ceratopteris richardii]